MLKLTAITGLFAVLVACGSSTPLANGRVAALAGTSLTRFAIRTPDGRTRTYYLQVPARHGARMPLVIVLHGADDTATNTIKQTDFAAVGRQNGMLIAYPQGYEDTWNEGAGHTPARVAGVNDVTFIKAMITQVEHRYPVDRSSVVAAGFSNGALMVQLLGCRLAGMLTMIAPVSGELPVSVSPTCHPSRPVGVLAVHGTADPTIPFGGGRFIGVGGGTTVLSEPASIRRWATLNGCAPSPTISHQGDRTVSTYPRCRSQVLVRLIAITGGGHGWPSDMGSLVAQAVHTSGRGIRPTTSSAG